jgi:hypothetical protein
MIGEDKKAGKRTPWVAGRTSSASASTRVLKDGAIGGDGDFDVLAIGSLEDDVSQVKISSRADY